MAELSIGSTIWVFNINRRVYQKGQSGPIWREHWSEATITGETSRSWIVRGGNPRYGGFNLSKAGVANGTYDKTAIALSQEEIDQAGWVTNNRYWLSNAISAIHDYAVLKKVAELIGYKERAD